MRTDDLKSMSGKTFSDASCAEKAYQTKSG